MEMSRCNSCVVILNKETKMSFFKTGEQEGKTGPVWGLAPEGGGMI
jgi:hypothetical protein